MQANKNFNIHCTKSYLSAKIMMWKRDDWFWFVRVGKPYRAGSIELHK
jgi:hypothetical protein